MFCVFDKSNGLYLRGARYDALGFNATTEVRIVLMDAPDRRMQRWDGANGVRPATAQEIAAFDAQQVLREFSASEQKILKALVIVLATRFGVSPATLRDEILAAYQAL